MEQQVYETINCIINTAPSSSVLPPSSGYDVLIPYRLINRKLTKWRIKSVKTFGSTNRHHPLSLSLSLPCPNKITQYNNTNSLPSGFMFSYVQYYMYPQTEITTGTINEDWVYNENTTIPTSFKLNISDLLDLDSIPDIIENNPPFDVVLIVEINLIVE